MNRMRFWDDLHDQASVDESHEQPYPDHWLIAGGPCRDHMTSWRGGLCMRCADQTLDRSKVFVKADDDDDVDWLLRFRAAIEQHDAVYCDLAHSCMH